MKKGNAGEPGGVIRVDDMALEATIRRAFNRGVLLRPRKLSYSPLAKATGKEALHRRTRSNKRPRSYFEPAEVSLWVPGIDADVPRPLQLQVQVVRLHPEAGRHLCLLSPLRGGSGRRNRTQPADPRWRRKRVRRVPINREAHLGTQRLTRTRTCELQVRKIEKTREMTRACLAGLASGDIGPH
jgi:hypothetical protein